MITFGFCRFIFTDHTDRTPKLPCERRNSYPKPNRQTKKKSGCGGRERWPARKEGKEEKGERIKGRREGGRKKGIIWELKA